MQQTPGEITKFEQFSQDYEDELSAKRDYAQYLFRHAQFTQALALFIEVLHQQVACLQTQLQAQASSGVCEVANLSADLQALSNMLIQDFNRAIFAFQEAGDFAQANQLTEQALQFFPNNVEFMTRQGIMLSLREQYEAAWAILQKAYALAPDDSSVLVAISYTAFYVGQIDKMREYGTQALMRKDQRAMREENLQRLRQWIGHDFVLPASKKIFEPDQPHKQIIAFSLWGADEKYTKPAILNAQLVYYIYPGWTCRFYCDDSVPCTVIDALLAAGAQVVMMHNSGHAYVGLFWRFTVANDPSINLFLVRDCDSVINCQERVAVEQWLASDKLFHCMRDWHGHTELLLAGLWGGVANVLPPLAPLMTEFYRFEQVSQNMDQMFLGLCVWPLIKESLLCHDDFFDFAPLQRFNKLGAFPDERQHVGCYTHHADAHELQRNYKQLYRAATKPKACVFTLNSSDYGGQYLNALFRENLTDAQVVHARVHAFNASVEKNDTLIHVHYNQFGNTPKVQSYWRQYLLEAVHSSPSLHIETGHLPGLAGLLDNLHFLLNLEVPVYLLVVHSEVVQAIWRSMNQFEFANSGLDWLYRLGEGYPNHIIDPKPFTQYGWQGGALWRTYEAWARYAYYQLLYAEHSQIQFVQVNYPHISAPDSAQALFQQLALPTQDLRVPEREPEPVFFDQSMLASLQQVQQRVACDWQQQAKDYYQRGQRLGLGPQGGLRG